MAVISCYKNYKRLLQSLKFIRAVIIYFNILANFKHQYYLYIIRQNVFLNCL
jgi:hypothetical protein